MFVRPPEPAVEEENNVKTGQKQRQKLPGRPIQATEKEIDDDDTLSEPEIEILANSMPDKSGFSWYAVQ